jgi:hypothetical protein
MSEAEQKNRNADRAGDSATSERLEELKSNLSKHFGKLTRWRALCQERDTKTDEDQIRLAEEVLAAPSTGTVAEWYGHHLWLQGKKSFNIDEYLAGRRSPTAGAAGDEASRVDDDQDGASPGRP